MITRFVLSGGSTVQYHSNDINLSNNNIDLFNLSYINNKLFYMYIYYIRRHLSYISTVLDINIHLTLNSQSFFLKTLCLISYRYQCYVLNHFLILFINQPELRHSFTPTFGAKVTNTLHPDFTDTHLQGSESDTIGNKPSPRRTIPNTIKTHKKQRKVKGKSVNPTDIINTQKINNNLPFLHTH